ncbi:hypothetical protein Hypma_014405 [Hypsizygus marmoreus]|uniref:Uncharacterized protein n=1 Tax=Hypsizygus marmoreus TaxID=39966 RepID=A0A369JI21_HYPMA|nr:hypothetical protein Hypma_014405 [Hypsizygus marmoreus]
MAWSEFVGREMTLEYSRRYWDPGAHLVSVFNRLATQHFVHPGFLHVGFLWRLHASFLQCSTVIRSAGACSSTVLTPKTLSCPTTLPQFLGRHPQHPKSVPLQSFLLHTHIVICPPTQIHTRIAGSTVSLVFSTHLRLFRITTSYQVSPRFASKAEHGSIQHLTLCVDDGCSMVRDTSHPRPLIIQHPSKSVFTFALTFPCANHKMSYPPNHPVDLLLSSGRLHCIVRFCFGPAFTFEGVSLAHINKPSLGKGAVTHICFPGPPNIRVSSGATIQHALRVYPPDINSMLCIHIPFRRSNNRTSSSSSLTSSNESGRGCMYKCEVYEDAVTMDNYCYGIPQSMRAPILRERGTGYVMILVASKPNSLAFPSMLCSDLWIVCRASRPCATPPPSRSVCFSLASGTGSESTSSFSISSRLTAHTHSISVSLLLLSNEHRLQEGLARTIQKSVPVCGLFPHENTILRALSHRIPYFVVL